MAKENNILDYNSIRSLKDLQYQRRLLSSRIDHQEIMISYRIRTIKDNVSPWNLAYMGFESVAARNNTVGVIFRAFNVVRSLFQSK